MILQENDKLSYSQLKKATLSQLEFKWALPLQQVLGLFPLGDLSSTVVVVLLPRGANVFCPVICWVLVTRRKEKQHKQLNISPQFGE